MEIGFNYTVGTGLKAGLNQFFDLTGTESLSKRYFNIDFVESFEGGC